MHIDTVGLLARFIFALCAVGLSAVILVMIRRNVIKEKYALLWLPLGGGFLVLSLFPDLLVAFSARLHLHYLTVVMLAVIVVFTAILLYFTMRMSQLREDVKALAQEIALARAVPHGIDHAAAAPAQEPSGWTPAIPEKIKDRS